MPPDRNGGPWSPHQEPTATNTSHPQQVAGICHVTAPSVAEQLRARRVASHRLPPMPCSCQEIWPHRVGCAHRDPADTEQLLDGAHAAAVHLLELGFTPLFSVDTLRGLWRRGSGDQALAQHLYDLVGGD